jgi:excisionase family DNA binding protein
MRKRKLKPLSPREIKRRQREIERRHRQLDKVVVATRWDDMHEAERVSGLGRSTLAELIRKKEIRSAKVGKRRLVDINFLLGYIEARAVGPAAATKESEQLPAAE